MHKTGGTTNLKVAATPARGTPGTERAAAFPRAPVYIVAAITAIAGLYWARAFLIPLLVGALASYALRPIVEWLARVRIPRVIGAALVVTLLGAGLTWGIAALGQNALGVIEELPDAARKLRQKITSAPVNGALAHMKEAAKEIEKTASAAAGNKPPAQTAPQPAPPGWVQSYLLAQSALLISMLAQAPIVLLLIYFLLASGENFRGKLLQLLGPRMTRKESVDALHEIDAQVQRYLLLMVFINVLIGVFTGLAFWALGVQQPVLWGVIAGVLHFIPYLGPAIVAVASGGAAFLQFNSIVDALIVVGATIGVAAAIGLVFMTWLQSRIAHINAAVLFIALLFFGWLWGPWGLLLGAPLLAIAKVVSDRVPSFKPVADLLGR